MGGFEVSDSDTENHILGRGPDFARCDLFCSAKFGFSIGVLWTFLLPRMSPRSRNNETGLSSRYGTKHGASLVHGFFPFPRGYGIGDDSRAYLDV
uniref:Uncharacterized protein n=1 Tax=Candidatus Kentrum sp. FW TaxID=2126338 RepID=A0A450TUF8_9GAMM|nr:MAG: hypothetical protein BECKFW1821C_GA0114237_103325 [Candidatus Kentron sp. FW]